MTRHLLIVTLGPKAGQEDEFNHWYDTQHLKDILTISEFVSARRFHQVLPAPDSPAAGYIAVYEVDTDDVEALQGKVMAAAGSEAMPLSPAIDARSMSLTFYAPLASAP